MALAAGTAVRTLQEFLTHLSWDEDRMRSRVASIVAEEHADDESIGVIDETGWVKKGKQTPGVQRQYCGSVGKQENSINTVHLGYTTGDFHCLLDGDLFLPESWNADRERCRRAGIPDEVVYRPKTEIALELYDRAVRHGVHFEWLTFDEGYGGKPPFLRALATRGQKFVGEIPRFSRLGSSRRGSRSDPFTGSSGADRGRFHGWWLAASRPKRSSIWLSRTRHWPLRGGRHGGSRTPRKARWSGTSSMCWSKSKTNRGCPRGPITCSSAITLSQARLNTS